LLYACKNWFEMVLDKGNITIDHFWGVGVRLSKDIIFSPRKRLYVSRKEVSRKTTRKGKTKANDVHRPLIGSLDLAFQ
jgi:hypothetical protein